MNVKQLHFTKMHALGNAYVYVDVSLDSENWRADRSMQNWSHEQWGSVARRVSDAKRGLGGDGLIVIQADPVDTAAEETIGHAKMWIYNADGSLGMHCGNGVRCTVALLYRKYLVGHWQIQVPSKVLVDSHVIAPDMIRIRAGCPKIETLQNGSYLVDIGNKHVVHLLEDADNLSDQLLTDMSANLVQQYDANIEFCTVLKDGSMRMRVYERGSGITEACGTGACAVASAALSAQLVRAPQSSSDEVLVHLDGGLLWVRWNPSRPEDGCWLRGEAQFIANGTLHL